jgi:hypothetical protein
VLLQTPISETPEPRHSRVVPMRANANSQNSRTLEVMKNGINLTRTQKMLPHDNKTERPVAFASSDHKVIWGISLIKVVT